MAVRFTHVSVKTACPVLVPVFIALSQGTLELCEPELTWKAVGTKQRTLDTEKGKS